MKQEFYDKFHDDRLPTDEADNIAIDVSIDDIWDWIVNTFIR